MQGYLETALQIIRDNSEVLTDWIIALSMAWGTLVITILGIIALVLYDRGKREEKTFFADSTTYLDGMCQETRIVSEAIYNLNRQ